MKLRGMLILTTGLLLGADAPKTATDHDKIQGEWKIVAETENGKESGPKRNEKVRVRFTADKIIFAEGDEKQEGVYKLDPSKKPATIEVVPSGGPNQGKKAHGLYQLDGDKLTICLTLEEDKEPPTDFTAKADSGRSLLRLERVKP
jgi:uncharacterized protein (TIGR03067 family)